MGWAGIRYELGQSLNTEYDQDGFLRAQPDGFGESPQVKSAEVVHPLGFGARPPATSRDARGNFKGGGGCKVRVGYDGNELHHVEFVGDQRDLALIPPIGDAGGSVQYAPGAPAPSFDKHDSEDGTKQIYIEVGDSAHLVTIGKDGNGKPIVEIVHAEGMAIQMLEGGVVIKNAAGDGYVEVNAGGITLNGNIKITGALDVGAVSFPLAKSAELLIWAANVTAAVNGLAPGAVQPLPASVATALTKGS